MADFRFVERIGPTSLRIIVHGLARILTSLGVSERTSTLLRRLLMHGWFLLLRRPLAGIRTLPDMLLIGVTKAGTSSLAAYLYQHPSFCPPFYKGMYYFNRASGKGLRFYRAHFPTVARRFFMTRVLRRRFVTGDFTPSYYFCPHVPRKVREALGEVKLVLMLRDPVERAFSHYRDQARRGAEPLTFEAALEAEEERLEGEMARMVADEHYYSQAMHQYGYLSRGKYIDYITAWHEHHRRENLLILQFEEFVRDPAAVLHEVCEFLGLESIELEAYPRFNPAPPDGLRIRDETRRRAAIYFAPYNRRLYDYLGRNLGWSE